MSRRRHRLPWISPNRRPPKANIKAGEGKEQRDGLGIAKKRRVRKPMALPTKAEQQAAAWRNPKPKPEPSSVKEAVKVSKASTGGSTSGSSNNQAAISSDAEVKRLRKLYSDKHGGLPPPAPWPTDTVAGYVEVLRILTR